ncbi:uncharacterized protein C8A04DRAFT_25989 [Dichotomopilus funicola]|uniref:Uncharacterized protein n=1 Tax=Dichotomopilus funicola TaxID=1934379 RepID=A0AAN6V794_9PEZI|nr:hypothetical protein C8A04DRAFT_25989 [Dichotomopilus funicola]
MDSLIDFASTNWSYYTIPVAFSLCMAPHLYSIKLAGKNHDLAPRKTEEHCAKDTTIDKQIVRRISRAKAASTNGFETLGLYAAAVVAANVARVPNARLNKLTVLYLLSRALYVYTYVVLQDNARAALLRVGVWFGGIGLIMALFTAAGKAVNAVGAV